MKTVGIISGIAPESTIIYYKEIVNSFLQLTNGKDYPQIIINSINMNEMLDYLSNDNLDGLTKYLLIEINKLKNAGANFGLLASNTPHIVFDRLKKDSQLPLLSIVGLTCNKAKALNLSKVGLFGTKFTMQNTFYRDIFVQEGIQIVTPDDESQNYIHNIYFSELVKGILLENTKQRLLSIVDQMIVDENMDGLILGGTELSLILTNNDRAIPFLDTTKIHIEGIIEYLMRDVQ